MKQYSQNDEERIIKSYFAGKKGHLLSLGENDGETLSNCRAMILDGWSADLVEPAKIPFQKLQNLYYPEALHCGQTLLHNVAIGNYNGEGVFYESGMLLNQGDTDLVSSLSINEIKRWGGSVNFKESKVQVITFEKLLEQTLQITFDFISIDCEGYDYDILQQMNLQKLKCKCICVEFNGKGEHFFDSYLRAFGMVQLYKNAENLIYVRQF